MTRRDCLIAAAFAASVAAWAWQHEKWHELNTRTAALAAEARVYSEMCRIMKGSKT